MFSFVLFIAQYQHISRDQETHLISW